MKLPPKRWKEYRTLRLEALKNDPTAFGSSHEEDIRLPPKEWKRRIRSVLFALVDNKPIGMIVLHFESKIKTKHIANIYGVYVKNEYRNLGIGTKLLESAISLAKKNKGTIKIDLNVNPKQKAAVNLYKKYDFKPVGILKKDLCINGKFMFCGFISCLRSALELQSKNRIK